MSEHDQLVLAIGVTVIVVAVSFSFVGWLLWHMFWDAYDYLIQQFKRWRNNRTDRHRNQVEPPSVYSAEEERRRRDLIAKLNAMYDQSEEGFYIPTTMRDFK
jgi:hypothetical protein